MEEHILKKGIIIIKQYLDKVQKQMGGADGKQQLVLRANQVDIIILIKNHAGAANIIPYHV